LLQTVIMNHFYSKFDFQSHLLFKNLPIEEKKLVETFMEDIHIKKGSALFYEDGIPTGIFQIVKGRAKKFKKGFSNQEQIFYIYTPGDVLGYHALLGEERYQDSCEALDDLELKFISETNFLKLLEELPFLKDAVIKNISHEFGVLANTIAVLAQKDQNTRLAIFLLVFDHRFKTMDPNFSGIDLSREDLANCIGTSRESLGRSLKQFKDKGMISIKKRSIYITDKVLFYKLLNLELA
jgi:CRP-like cAMP-binding protein